MTFLRDALRRPRSGLDYDLTKVGWSAKCFYCDATIYGATKEACDERARNHVAGNHQIGSRHLSTAAGRRYHGVEPGGR